MKTVGLIGGMSWESTVGYYRILNQTVAREYGQQHSAKCLLYSVDFQEIEECQSSGDWERSAAILIDAAQRLERGGADFILICTNTMHKVFDQVQSSVSIPLLHIAQVTADELIKNKINKVGLLGTIYTMEQDFYKSVLVDRNIEVLIPNEDDRKFINRVIYNELCHGLFEKSAKERFLDIIKKLADQGAQGIILGCTEIGMLVDQADTDIRLFDTTEIHAYRAAMKSLE